MCSLEILKIDLKELNEGVSTLNFSLGDAYFESLDEEEIKRGNISVSVNVKRTENYFEFDFHTEGTVVIPCDICLDDMDQAIETDDRLIVKFGEEYSEDDDLITVDEREGVLDVAWFIYEFIALNIPAKHVHT
ncbi:YceD family protein, partial [Prevotella sp.]